MTRRLLIASLLAALCAGWSGGAGAALSEREHTELRSRISEPLAWASQPSTYNESSRSDNPRPDPHPSAKGKRVTIVQPDGVYVCSRTLCITIDLAKWAKIGARYERARVAP